MSFFDKKPEIIEIQLKNHYAFMYEGFIISTQQDLFVLMEEKDGKYNALQFDFLQFKYGYPNDESMGSHPMAKYGLGSYGLFEAENSFWIVELRNGNRIHPRHNDESFSNYKHYIARFKDVTLDVVSIGFKEIQMTKNEILVLLEEQLNYLKTD